MAPYRHGEVWKTVAKALDEERAAGHATATAPRPFVPWRVIAAALFLGLVIYCEVVGSQLLSALFAAACCTFVAMTSGAKAAPRHPWWEDEPPLRRRLDGLREAAGSGSYDDEDGLLRVPLLERDVVAVLRDNATREMMGWPDQRKGER